MEDRNLRIEVRHRGGPDCLEPVEEPVPQPGAGEVRVRVQAAGVSAYDRMLRSHWFPGFPRTPYSPGLDAVGTVEALGSGVPDLEVGQLVAGGPWPDGGGYARYVCRPAADFVPVPGGLDPAEVVCLVTDFLTAHQVMHDTAHVRSGERILAHGGAGGVGSAILQLGRVVGLQMYATASLANHELVSALGATPIDYRDEDFVERVRSLTGDGVDVVFDPIGGAAQLRRSYRCLRPGGRLVWFGVAAISRRGVRVIPESLVVRLLLSLRRDGRQAPLPSTAERAEDRAAILAELMGLLADGSIRPRITARIPLEQAARAHELLDRGGHAGKVVLVTEPS